MHIFFPPLLYELIFSFSPPKNSGYFLFCPRPPVSLSSSSEAVHSPVVSPPFYDPMVATCRSPFPRLKNLITVQKQPFLAAFHPLPEAANIRSICKSDSHEIRVSSTPPLLSFYGMKVEKRDSRDSKDLNISLCCTFIGTPPVSRG